MEADYYFRRHPKPTKKNIKKLLEEERKVTIFIHSRQLTSKRESSKILWLWIFKCLMRLLLSPNSLTTHGMIFKTSIKEG